MKWDGSGWYKWNESEMKYISQVKEPEEVKQTKGEMILRRDEFWA